MNTSRTPSAMQKAFQSVGAFDYFQHCVHCGLCLPKCPTYVELAEENDSPRGRIYLMQALATGRLEPSPTVHGHLEACLNCRGCETVCPSGVEYGVLLETYRAHVGPHPDGRSGLRRLIDRMLLRVLPSIRRTRRLVGLTRLAHAVGLFDFLQRSGALREHAANMTFPEVLQRLQPDGTPQALPEFAEPADGQRTTVELFQGCVGEAITPHTNRATHRVLLRNGCAVKCPTTQACCGALHYHGGDTRGAQQMARKNIDAFEHADNPIIVNAAGCGMMLKEYAALLADDAAYASKARRFVERVRDVHTFLVELPLAAPGAALPRDVAYHDACHLCHGQGIREAPRALLRSIPGLRLQEVVDSDLCCGAAGAYSLTQPAMARRLARRKLERIAATQADCVAAGNVGCILHLMQHAQLDGQEIDLLHPVELLDAAYSLESNASTAFPASANSATV